MFDIEKKISHILLLDYNVYTKRITLLKKELVFISSRNLVDYLTSRGVNGFHT